MLKLALYKQPSHILQQHSSQSTLKETHVVAELTVNHLFVCLCFFYSSCLISFAICVLCCAFSLTGHLDIDSSVHNSWIIGAFINNTLVMRDFKLPLAKRMRPALFWVITRWVVVISYRHFGITYRSLLDESKVLESLKMRPIGYPETSVKITTTRRVITQNSAGLGNWIV